MTSCVRNLGYFVKKKILCHNYHTRQRLSGLNDKYFSDHPKYQIVSIMNCHLAQSCQSMQNVPSKFNEIDLSYHLMLFILALKSIGLRIDPSNTLYDCIRSKCMYFELSLVPLVQTCKTLITRHCLIEYLCHSFCFVACL